MSALVRSQGACLDNRAICVAYCKIMRHVARMRERRDACRVLVGKPEGRRIFERSRRRWEDNIKIDLREVE